MSYEYDELDRRTAHRQPNGLVSTFSYDPEANMTGRIDQNGQSFTYEFDEINREVLKTYPTVASPFMRIDEITTEYDGNNNPVRMVETKFNALTNSQQLDICEKEFDLLDRETRDLQRGREINYSYDDNGNRLSVSSAGGNTTYTYDSRNRLITATTTNGVSTYVYTDDNKQERVSYANGTVTRYDYDNADRILSVNNERVISPTQAELISQYVYTYDDNSNRLSQTETQAGFATGQVQTTAYSYDRANRMTGYAITDQASGGVQTFTYTFDNNYNRIGEVETLTSLGITTTTKDRTSTFDANNRITQIIDNLDSDTIDYVYDNNGNTLTKTDNTQAAPEITSFLYDSRNQLVQLTRGPPSNQTSQGLYDYDAKGMRIRHLQSERGDVEYTYDGRSILEEREINSDTLIAHYRYSDRLISLNTPTDEQYYHYSALRTTTNLTNNQGQTQVSYRTDVWGNITEQQGTSPNRQVFTGQEHDENTGLVYFGARYYDPDTGRFINEDTYLGESMTPPSLHRYLYAYSNPGIYYDPTGNAPLLDDIANNIHLRAQKAHNDAQQYRGEGYLAGHSKAAAVDIGGVAVSAIGGAVDLLNLAADQIISSTARKAEALGVEFSEYGVVSESRANLKEAGESAVKAVQTGAEIAGKFTSREGRSELGTPLVETTAGLLEGDHDAAQSAIKTFANVGIGAAAGGRVKTKTSRNQSESERVSQDELARDYK